MLGDRVIKAGKYVIDLDQVQCVHELVGTGHEAVYTVEFRNGKALTFWNSLPHPTEDPYEIPRQWFISSWLAYANHPIRTGAEE